jgi:hypothetical protein
MGIRDTFGLRCILLLIWTIAFWVYLHRNTHKRAILFVDFMLTVAPKRLGSESQLINYLDPSPHLGSLLLADTSGFLFSSFTFAEIS